MASFCSFNDRFYRITKTDHDIDSYSPASSHTFIHTVDPVTHKKQLSPPLHANPTSYTSLNQLTTTKSTATPTTSPTAEHGPSSMTKYHCLNPLVDIETADGHFSMTILWRDAQHLVKCGYHVENQQLVVIVDTRYGIYQRTVDLPSDADTTKGTIHYTDGLFKAHFPRSGMNWVNWIG
ncbi:hypothetical protein H4R33_006971 [Dimargaris cristalligena]|uniref:Uncharacterized protein n=1 Tax=Dimargaris cristalligena TaxID=215637 RepID=A0A4P9ZJP3_9FUNG|nr:hypothetical protein H4R33_006971 [Dimargaris cristalligena]RKP33476.1 hypothetical protein BJ085DRAFT_40160 [Dimargaris cristalligena]|eukprot:RKP33476.1 hypothetical protein BJ085DRAFT_40160 [Dimargaris cristalligena]